MDAWVPDGLDADDGRRNRAAMTGSPQPSEPMERTDLGRITLIRLRARRIVDEEDIHEIAEALNDLVDREGRNRIVLNLGLVDYPSSAFLGKILWLTIKLRKAGGRLALCRLSEAIARMFQPDPHQPLGQGIGFFREEAAALEWADADG